MSLDEVRTTALLIAVGVPAALAVHSRYASPVLVLPALAAVGWVAQW